MKAPTPRPAPAHHKGPPDPAGEGRLAHGDNRRALILCLLLGGALSVAIGLFALFASRESRLEPRHDVTQRLETPVGSVP